MEIKYRLISELIPADYNPRQLTEKQFKDLQASFRNLEVLEPAVINMNPDRLNVIISGHQRLRVADSLGMTEFPCVEVNFSPEKEKEANIRMNKNTGDWDMDALANNFEVDDLVEWGFDDLNFELDTEEGLTDEDAVPDEPEEPVTKLGDLYKLGEHRLLCGDSTSIDAVERLMDGEKADMVFTDPPYNHGSEDKGVAASVSKAHEDLKNSDWDKNFDFNDVFGSIEILMSENCTVYVCTSHHLFGDIQNWMKERSNLRGYCVWSKPNPMPSLMKRHWTWSAELICYATYGKHTFNFPSTGHAKSVWEITKKSDGTHPTQKPIEVCEMAINHSSGSKHIIADLFGGSGSTLIACQKTNRNCRMMELDPKYCDVIIQRWEQYTGKKAELLIGERSV